MHLHADHDLSIATRLLSPCCHTAEAVELYALQSKRLSTLSAYCIAGTGHLVSQSRVWMNGSWHLQLIPCILTGDCCIAQDDHSVSHDVFGTHTNNHNIQENMIHLKRI